MGSPDKGGLTVLKTSANKYSKISNLMKGLIGLHYDLSELIYHPGSLEKGGRGGGREGGMFKWGFVTTGACTFIMLNWQTCFSP